MIATYLRPTLTDHGLVRARTLDFQIGTAKASPQIFSNGNETSGTASSTLVRDAETTDDTGQEAN
jgi:hypothetical protein